MKKRNELIKKIKKGLKIATVTALLAVSLTSCGTMKQEYASQEEIVEAADTLDCDMSYMMKENGNFIRMKHNNGEPIYVCFDEEFSEDLKSKAIDSLDYIFGIVGKINDNYHYRIVDKTEFDLKFNKTKIFYTYGELVSVGTDATYESSAHLESHYKNRDFESENPVYYYYELKINKDLVNDEQQVKYSLNHELLHAFGFGDVYNTSRFTDTTNKFYGNTLMNNKLDFEIVTPNDLACLISLYADEDCDISQMKQQLEKYEGKFYKYYADLCKQKVGTNEKFEEEDFDFTTSIIAEDLDKTRHEYDYIISVENGTYSFEIYDRNSNKLIDKYQGEVVAQNGILILKDVQLKFGLKPNNTIDNYQGGYIQDLMLLSKNGNVILYSYNNNDVLRGDISYEKSLTQ